MSALPITVALCNYANKPFDFSPDSYYRFFLPAIVLFIVLCPVAVSFARSGKRELPTLSPLQLLRDWWTLPLCFAIYSNLKVLMPLLATRIHDQWFLDWERYICGPILGTGQYPTRWLLEHAGPTTTWIMDQAYVSFFYLYPISFALVYFGGHRREFRRLLIGILLVYYIGAALYLLVPVMGPVYYVTECPEVHELVLARSKELPQGATVPKLQHYLLVNYQALRRNPQTFVTRPFLGIAAFPSLHVAHTLLFLLSARRTNGWLFACYMPLFIALSISTVFWGWHWVGDGIAGACMALIIDYVVSHKVVPVQAA